MLKLNGMIGARLLTGSRILVDNFAELNVQDNQQGGIILDDGSSLSFGQTIAVTGVTTLVQQNGVVDVGLTFGSHLTYIPNDTLQTITCDGSSQIRGPGAPVCPH
jgi:hypothetical protein